MPKGIHNNHATASRQHRWHPGGSVSSGGYVKIRVGKSHPLADQNGYTYEHLLNWVSAGNAAPQADEIIHHVNGDKTDNRIENLRIMKRCAHSVSHHSTLSDDDVVAIRIAYSNGSADMPRLSRKYNVPIQRVSKIVRGKTRKSAGGPILTV